MKTIEISDLLPEEIPTLYDGPALNLPAGAVQNGDGSVTLTLAYPKTLRFRTGDQVREEQLVELLFQRVNGAAARKVIGARDKEVSSFAAAARMAPARASLVINALDSADGTAANEVILELMGGASVGLPEHAASTSDGVTLSLLFPCTDSEGNEHAELSFPRMTVRERNQAQAQPDVMDFVVGKAIGQTPKQARELLDKMDGADYRSINRVILFLFGIGR